MTTSMSIIVPVYNLEHLLPKCVDSILAQTFRDFELILVNDGSTDKSGMMCDAYAASDCRIKVIHKKNGGTASSRNAALKIAMGEYIGFVDNDDYVNQNMFETLYNVALLYNSDIVVCDFMKVVEDEECNARSDVSTSEVEHFNNKDTLYQFYTENNITFVVPWNKLYKRHLFKDVEYQNGNIYDDETVAHKLHYLSEKTTYIHTPLYYYVQRNESMMNAPYNVKRLGAVYALKNREVFFRAKKEKELRELALKAYLEKFFWHYYMAKANVDDVERELKSLKQTFNKSILHLLRLKGVGWRQKTMWFIFFLHPKWYELLRDANLKRRRKQHLSQ